MENFLFYKTNKSFNNFKSFNNHVRSYAKRNGLNLSQLLKEKYALDYCKNNSLIYEIIDEDYFLNKIDEIDIDSLVQVIETKTIRNLAKSFRRQFVKCPQV